MVSSQRSVLMKPLPQSFHFSGRPSALICSRVFPASILSRTRFVVSTSMPRYAFKSSRVESGPWPGMMAASAGSSSITSAMFSARPSTSPPLSRSTKGNRPGKKASPGGAPHSPGRQPLAHVGVGDDGRLGAEDRVSPGVVPVPVGVEDELELAAADFFERGADFLDRKSVVWGESVDL